MIKPITVKVKKLTDDAKLPFYQHPDEKGGNSGADLYVNHEAVLLPHYVTMVNCGICVEVPVGVDMQVRTRSGLASKGIFVINSPGTIDSSYRGEIKVLLFNTTDAPFFIEKYDRIAQAVFAPVFYAEFEEADELSDTQRGEGRLSSTGK